MAEKTERELEKGLKDLTQGVAYFLAAVDYLMKQSESETRGKAIARLCNELDIANDSAMRFTLGMSFPQIRKVKDEGEALVLTARGKANG